jgi:selenocysteine lyase/cysteine desulfurase
MMVYCDYTASGRCLRFVENYLQKLQRNYANTHTEDDITGRNMTRLLHEAENAIKGSVNAGPDGRIIAVGTGATGAIDKLQQILGVACPPATNEYLKDTLIQFFGLDRAQEFLDFRKSSTPVVFVGPYEHHSNEISWRQGIAKVVSVELTDDGDIDLRQLEELLQLPEYADRQLIGSFSAASNVTGLRSEVHAIARVLHRHGAIACFDYAACAPYVPIDMNPPADANGDSSLDAIFVSPHKFLGGPGSSGVLVFNKRIYPESLPPTVAAGGTVDYVSQVDQDFIQDIEEREKAGTPGVLQTIKAALAFQIKDFADPTRIAAREHELLERAMQRWNSNSRIEILGNADTHQKIGIVSFNVRDPNGRYLHPKFITALLNDLFGIQSRAGCSCAGPYGHRLLDINLEVSEKYRACVQKGLGGLKPGWCRIGFHYTMDDAEANFVIDAVEFISKCGDLFMPEYDFHLDTGMWTHKTHHAEFDSLDLAEAMTSPPCVMSAVPDDERVIIYKSYLDEAAALAQTLANKNSENCTLSGEMGELQFFALPRESVL